MDFALEFEKPLLELENQIKELSEANKTSSVDLSEEVKALRKKADELNKEIYNKLTPWERVQLSRHPSRPHAINYIENLITDFHELHGDRYFSDDASMIAGFGYIDGIKVCIVGIEKGRKTEDKIKRNFGMSSPEGYRKAIRVMELASNFKVPIITFVDTPGAYPGIGAEERGQAQAIASNLEAMFGLKTPILSIVIGEGGSGGALGIAIADKVLMMEYSVYSVISPESCASILWSDPKQAEVAANSLKLDPKKALELKVIDGIIKEPIGGAHKNIEQACNMVKNEIKTFLNEAMAEPEKYIENRYEKFRQMGNITLLR